MIRRIISIVLAALAAIPLLIALLVTCVEAVTFQLSFYVTEYDKYSNAQTIGMTSDDLISVTEELINYLKSDRDDLNMQYAVHGEMREVFNEREKLHMTDVYHLFELARQVRLFAAIAAVVLIGASLLVAPKRYRLHSAGLGYLFGTVLFALIGGVLAVLITMDYETWFIRFHLWLFTNDMWLLDPSTDILIMMMPLDFFKDITLRIGMFFGLGALATVLVALAGVIPGGRARKLSPAAIGQAPAGTDLHLNPYVQGQASQGAIEQPAQQPAWLPHDSAVQSAHQPVWTQNDASDAQQQPTWQQGGAQGILQSEWRQPDAHATAQWGGAQQPPLGEQFAAQVGASAPEGAQSGEQHVLRIDAVAAGDGEVYRIQADREPPTSAEAIFESFGLSEKDDAPLGPQSAQTPQQPLPPTWGAQVQPVTTASQLPSWANPIAPAAPEQAAAHENIPVNIGLQPGGVPQQSAFGAQSAQGVPPAQTFAAQGGVQSQTPFGTQPAQILTTQSGTQQQNPFSAQPVQSFPAAQIFTAQGGIPPQPPFGAQPAQSFPPAGFPAQGSAQSQPPFGAQPVQSFPPVQGFPAQGGAQHQSPFNAPGFPPAQGFPQQGGAQPQSPFGAPGAQSFQPAQAFVPGNDQPQTSFGVQAAQGYPAQSGAQPQYPLNTPGAQGVPWSGAPSQPAAAPQWTQQPHTQQWQQPQRAQQPEQPPNAPQWLQPQQAQQPAQSAAVPQWTQQLNTPQTPPAQPSQQPQQPQTQWQPPAQAWSAPPAQQPSAALPSWSQPPQQQQYAPPPAQPGMQAPAGKDANESVNDMLKRLNDMMNNMPGDKR